MHKNLIVALLFLLACLSGCEWLSTPPLTADEGYTSVPALTVSAPQSTSEPEPEPEPELLQARLMAVGDDLIHDTVISAGKLPGGGYDYTMLFEHISDYIAQADLACINQETIFTANSSKYGGYPLFGTPTMVGDAIAAAGFDIVLHASNHSLDMTSRGVYDTLEFWQKYPDMIVLGLSGTEEDYYKTTIVERNGITFALFNYTYGLNGLTPPGDKPWLVNVMSEETKAKITAELEEARGLADIVIVYPHWGSEYVYKPDSFQKEWAALFASCNVDIVIGAHPHVLQPMDSMERADGGEMLIYYSLGNFCSHQAEIPRMLGGLADITVCKQGDEVWIESAQLIPIVTQIEDGYFTTYLLSEYTDELAQAHKFTAKFGSSQYNVNALWQLYTQITGFTQEDMEFYGAKDEADAA